MNEGVSQPARGGGSRWLKPALLVSLAFNLVILGLAAGAFWRADGPGRHGDGSPALAAFGRPYVAALPEADRRALRDGMRREFRRGLPGRAERRRLYDGVLSALRAEPFDAEALARAVAAQAALSVSVQQSAQTVWVRYVSQMSPAARQDYAAAIEEALTQGRRSREVRDAR